MAMDLTRYPGVNAFLEHLAGQLNNLDRFAGGSLVNYTAVTSDSTIATGDSILYGIICLTNGTMAGVHDGTTAAGQLILPSQTLTAGQQVNFGGMGIICSTGIFADWTSGSFLVLFS